MGMLAPARELKTRAANLGHPTNGLVDQMTSATIAVIILSFLKCYCSAKRIRNTKPALPLDGTTGLGKRHIHDRQRKASFQIAPMCDVTASVATPPPVGQPIRRPAESGMTARAR